MSYQQLLTEDQRLVILRFLTELPGYKANSSILHNLLATYGHEISRDKVKTELNWLAEQGLITLQDLPPLLIATLTERGDDVAKGRSTISGVNKPRA